MAIAASTMTAQLASGADLEFILCAHRAASRSELGATEDDLLADLKAGRVTFYLLREHGGPIACVGVQWGRRSALFTTFYRDRRASDPSRILSDARRLARRAMLDFRRMGVEHVAAVVETAHPDAARLVRLYRRLLGLTPRGALLGASIATMIDTVGEKAG